MIRLVLVLFLFVSIPLLSQESFTPAPAVFNSQRLEAELESSYQFQLSSIKDLKGKEANYVKESYKNRRDFLLGLLSEGEFIFESPIYDYVKGIFDQVLAANPEIDPKTVMLLSRSGIPNAFTTGDGFFVINLGLLVRLYNADQLAFVICHELGHQILNHTNNRIRVAASEVADPNRKKRNSTGS
jgi:Zn-dependent protease with chaperone function